VDLVRTIPTKFRNFATIGACALVCGGATAGRVSSSGPLASLPKLGTVDERFQSYNVEMVEITGGQFWAPYGGPRTSAIASGPPRTSPTSG